MEEVKTVSKANRLELASLLEADSVSDAMAAYYALEHPEDRVSLYSYYAADDGPTGFLAVAQTGLDLFHPVAIPFVSEPRGLVALLRAGLNPGRPVILYLPSGQRSRAEQIVSTRNLVDTELLLLDPNAFEPVINVLVVEQQTPSGTPRYELRSQRRIHAASGVNWIGASFAEVYLEAKPESRSRGFRKSVLAAIAGRMLGEGRFPLYRVEEGDSLSRNEAYRIGFRPTGVRQVVGQAVLGSSGER